jgi:hypothetical protein
VVIITVSKYVFEEDAAKHVHPQKIWAVGLSLEVGDWVWNNGVTFEVLIAHVTIAPDEPILDVVQGAPGPAGANGAPGAKGDDGAPGDTTNSRFGALPSGTKNGINKTFTLPDTPLSSKIALYWLGQRQTPNVDYSVTGNTITLITFAPASGDALVADYKY